MKNLIVVALILTFISFNAYGQTVPSSVVKAFNKKFPDVSKVKWDKENAHEYEASFKMNDIKYSANFSDNGEWLETETASSFDKLPQEVQDAFNTNYNGYKAKATSTIETSKGTTKYEIEYKNGKKTVELFYDDKGNAVK